MPKRPIGFLALLLATGGCSNVQTEIEIPIAPALPLKLDVPLVYRSISGQVFWHTEGGDTVLATGQRVMIYDANHLLQAREIIEQYSAHNFDTHNSYYSGSPGRITRARMRLENTVDLLWKGLGEPYAIVMTDAEGKFAYTGFLPDKLGLYCYAGRRVAGDIERIRWAVLEDEIGNAERLLLTNENRSR